MARRVGPNEFATSNAYGALGTLRSTLASGGFIQILAALAGFAAVPLLIADLGSQSFGALVVIVSLGPWLIVVDGALSQATRLVAGEQRSGSQHRAPVWLLASARRIALGITAVNLALVVAAFTWAPLLDLMGSPEDLTAAQVTWATAAFALPIVASTPGAYCLGALEGVGRTVAAVVIAGLGPIVTLPATALAAQAGGGLVIMASIQGFAFAIPRFLAWGYWHLRPSIYVDAQPRSSPSPHLRTMLVAQLAAVAVLVMAQTGLAPTIVASQLGADAAASFGLVWRLVMGALIPVAVVTPLLAGGIAAARGTGWTRGSDRALLRLLAQAAVAGAGAAALLLVFGPPAARWVSRGEIGLPSDIFLAGAAYVLATFVSAPLSLAFAGPRAVRTSVVLNATMTALALALSVALTGRLGPAGPLWACALAAVVATCFWLSMWRVRREWLTEVHHPETSATA